MNPIPTLLNDLKGDKHKVSILVNNPLPERIGEGYESYVGYIQDFTDQFLLLSTPNNTKLESIVLRYEMILSIWIYRENK